MPIELLRRSGMNVHFIPENIIPSAVTPLQTAVFCGTSKFVEDKIDTEVKYLGYSCKVNYKTTANISEGVVNNLTPENLNSVEVFLDSNSGIIPLENSSIIFHSQGDITDNHGSFLITNISDSFATTANIDGAVSNGSKMFVSASSDFITSGVEVGQYITFSSNSYKIINVIDANTLEVEEAFNNDITNIEFVVSILQVQSALYVFQNNDSIETNITDIASSGIIVEGSLTLEAGVLFDVTSKGDFTAYPDYIIIKSNVPYRGNVLISYIADRHDLDYKTLSLANINDLKETFGENALDFNNPIGYALKKCIEVTGGTTVVYAICVAQDDEDSHIEAANQMRIMRETQPFYFIVPLSQKESVGDVYKSLVNALNKPEQRYTCVLLWTPDLIYKDILIPKDSGIISSTTSLRNEDVNFFELGVSGGFINIISSNGDESGNKYNIIDISNDGHELFISTNFSETPGDIVEYEILASWFRGTTSTDKQAQAVAYHNYLKSINNERVWVNLPSKLIDQDTIVDGCYQNASDVGLMLVVNEAKPLGNRRLFGFDGTLFGNDYFTSGYGEQIHIIESGGCSMAKQTVEGADLIYVEEYTTNVESEIYKFRSVIRNRDSIKMIFINELCSTMGQDIINKSYLSKIGMAASAILKRLQKYGQVGPQASIRSLEVDPDNPSNILIHLDIGTLYPGHSGDVFLHI